MTYQIECSHKDKKDWDLVCGEHIGYGYNAHPIYESLEEARIDRLKYIKLFRGCGWKFRIVEISKRVVK